MGTHKYTPGPWNLDEERMTRIEDAIDGEWQAVGLNDADGFAEIVAFCHPANARLIAAAPELLEALELALYESGCDGDLCYYAWHELARKAIANATGEQ